MKIKTLLIANRGEIACRIARTARASGITPVGVHSDADANALHVREIGHSVCIGGGPASESYLKIDAVIAAAKSIGADAIHPGYGFLAENSDFARAVEAAGMVFMGPMPDTLERFGDKASAKEAAVAASVPVISGAEGARSDPQEIADEVRAMGLPVLLKAVGGGGGRGQRLVTDEATLTEDIEGALREAKSTFGSEGLLLERFLPEARHVEVQIAGDGKGQVVHLFERDCTLQRRHQKVIEEAPAWGLPRALLDKIAHDAVRLGETLDYRGLGTVEFLVAGDEYFFLEVNPRIQVEHPVTEAITGLDLVALHLRIAEGAGLGLVQDDLAINGHAVEARLYAEDPAMQFAPSTGTLTTLSLPDGLRIDSGVEEGDAVTPFYDPMIAKMVVHAADRETALAQLATALDRVAVEGVQTNRAFLTALARNPEFEQMQVHTRWIDGKLEELTQASPLARPDLWKAAAAVLFVASSRSDASANPWENRDTFTGWRLGLGGDVMEAGQRVTLTDAADTSEELRVGPIKAADTYTVLSESGDAMSLAMREFTPGRWRISKGDDVFLIDARLQAGVIEMDTPEGRLVFRPAAPLAFAGGDAAADRAVVSPLTGMIAEIKVADGQDVAEGDVIAVMESMKLEISIRAATAGIASNISVSNGDMVDRGQVIAEILPSEE
ncbi:acetyl/propionyl/methylcrotonyl-CoA carboxylase subunit alpha [Sulfitobacter geojensis]|uniref:Biotin/lipoyl-binding protein n=1 Tax=Sulfitobacter geojensis TaxID=1342299 RepID=A0AAE2W1J9_9RHOB|nr:biotin carboxylase N-terminal domain-containing protein [Sulfitobacter geojensis]MBM1691217.1 biotin/lipoyl-binding protein [Sulfitobacter geojensis]MBM1695283.1 biotin/lipoyl-binding protein [Sulfitobacter geojensis]MBM1707383.1 biotin/lipoyl-binding protein [Sulfitobacter geojensis]MBM1711533.1 biotin/lipoyl-binding protein [Sulfitobacter geojensis]MBM1715508.1 biotin/lipoyl-binding protein [Sulfitobacter geojensis]